MRTMIKAPLIRKVLQVFFGGALKLFHEKILFYFCFVTFHEKLFGISLADSRFYLIQMGKSIIAFKIAQEPTSTAKNSTVTSKMILP